MAAHDQQSGGLVERFHWQLKAPLPAVINSRWSENLPLAISGLWKCFKEMRTTKNGLVFGCTFWLLRLLVVSSRRKHFTYGDFVKRHSQHIQTLRASPSLDQRSPVRVPATVNNLNHVFVSIGGVSSSQQPTRRYDSLNKTLPLKRCRSTVHSVHQPHQICRCGIWTD